MAIKGNLREASLADVLQLLALGRKTGCLSVSDRNSFGRIYFEHGLITHASIINRRDRLGDLLVKSGQIRPGELEAAIAEQTGQEGPRIGEILIARGSLTRPELEHFIRIQIEEAVYYLFTWSQGTFYFEPGELPEPGESLVAIHPEGLLLEGARRVDEWTLIEKKVSSPDLVFVLDRSHGDPEEAELSESQRRILPLVDGRRSVREIVEDSGLLEFEACKALYGLVQAGYARQRGRKRELVAANVRPGRVQEHTNLGIAFYRTSMFEEAEREFLRILELDPGYLEAHFHLGLVALRRGNARNAARRFMRLIEAGGRWSSAFHNLALALEMAGRLEDALLTVEEGLAQHPTARALLLSRGILLSRLARWSEASEAFDLHAATAGAGAPPPPSYYAYSALALAASGRTVEARQRASEGLALHPRVPELLVNVGVLLERVGEAQEAENLFARALEESPELVQAQRGLAEALYRRGAYDEAGEMYAALLKRREAGHAELLFKLGNIAYKRGDRSTALGYWQETLDADPGHSLARTNLDLVGGAMAVGR